MTGRLSRRLKGLIRAISLRDFQRFMRSLWRKRRIIAQLVQKDFKQQYLGSFLGLVWAILQPLVFVMVLWAVFATGFRHARSAEPVPFVLWLMTGMFCWYFISNAVSRSTTAVVSHNYLVKKIRFQLNILPVVKILVELRIHMIFLAILAAFFFIEGAWPTLWWLQLLYYIPAGLVLGLGLGWTVSAVNVFSRDMEQFVQLLVRIGFWMTPIFWKIDRVPESLQWIFKLNPAFYLVQGYRDSLIYGIGFWQHPWLSLYFWTVTLLILLTGAVVFKRLRPHFADVI